MKIDSDCHFDVILQVIWLHHGLTQEECAKIAGINLEPYISSETGKKKPYKKTKERISKNLGYESIEAMEAHAKEILLWELKAGGIAVKILREARGISQNILSNQTRLSLMTISEIESGHGSNGQIIEEIATLLGYTTLREAITAAGEFQDLGVHTPTKVVVTKAASINTQDDADTLTAKKLEEVLKALDAQQEQAERTNTDIVPEENPTLSVVYNIVAGFQPLPATKFDAKEVASLVYQTGVTDRDLKKCIMGVKMYFNEEAKGQKYEQELDIYLDKVLFALERYPELENDLSKLINISNGLSQKEARGRILKF